MTVLTLLVAWTAWSYSSGGIVWILLDPSLEAESKVSSLKDFFEQWGAFSPVVYVVIVTIEVVVAPIPGTLLYLPGGVIFGGFVGGSLSLAGNVLGAGISCSLMRSLLGRKWTASFFRKESLGKLHAMIEKHGFWIVLLLRLNPLTSSDLVSYASGLTRITVMTVMIGTLIGMAPLCYAQAYFAEEMFTMFPWLVWPMLVGCVAYAVVVVLVVRRLAESSSPEETDSDS